MSDLGKSRLFMMLGVVCCGVLVFDMLRRADTSLISLFGSLLGIGFSSIGTYFTF